MQLYIAMHISLRLLDIYKATYYRSGSELCINVVALLPKTEIKVVINYLNLANS